MLRLIIALNALATSVAVAAAGKSAASLAQAGMPAQCAGFGEKVSASKGDFNSISPIVNGVTCYGAFQFCSAKNRRDGGSFGKYSDGLTPEQFLSDPNAQVKAWMQYERDSWTQVQISGAVRLVGENVCYNNPCRCCGQIVYPNGLSIRLRNRRKTGELCGKWEPMHRRFQSKQAQWRGKSDERRKRNVRRKIFNSWQWL